MDCCIIICRLDQNNRLHDHNTNKFIECIKTSHNVCGTNSLVAIKVTALVRPGALKKYNTFLTSIENRSILPSLFELINQEGKNETTIESFQQTIKSFLAETKVIFANIFNSLKNNIL